MQQISAALQAALIDIDARVTPRVLVDLYEFYEPDYVPSATGFDSDDAIESFAAQAITWNGNAYRREVISRGDIIRNMGEKTNSVTLTFSNISRYLATLAQSQQIEGLFLVIRCVVPSVTDDSIVLFVGRCDKPSDIDKQTFTLAARQDFGNINQELPPRVFEAEDPNGRVPSDPLYEGFRIQPSSGTYDKPVETPSTSFFGRLFGKKKKSWETRQWSSLDSTPYGSVVPMVFGRCQMALIPIMFADIGYSLIGVWVVGEGRVDTFSNVTVRDEVLILVTERDAYGDPGGTGTNNHAVNPSTFPQGAIAHGYLSKTAYTVLSIRGSSGETVDEAPTVTALVRGLRIPVPDSSGDWNSEAWSNNPVDVSRFILTDPRLVRIDQGFMEDDVNYLTHLHCDEALIDESNGEVSLIPAADLPQAGIGIRRYPSTGVINTRLILYYDFGDHSTIPEETDNDYTGIDLTDIPTTFEIVRLLRKRYTFNAPITERVRAVDFLYKNVFPTAKLFLRINKRGKYELRSEVPSDATMIRAATVVGATAINVLDVMPWKTGADLLTGRILLGYGLTTSEVRNVASALYSTSGNAVTLATAVTGGVTATASGATLSGGSTTVQASGTVTIGGSPDAGDTVEIEIDGIAVNYTLNADDTTGTVAALLTQYINATPRLRRYISAEWLAASPTIITIRCKHGALNLDSALLKAHSAPIADPTVAPSLGSSAGALQIGTYLLAYAEVNALGQSALSPIASTSLVTANQKIDVGALALVGTSRNWYMSDAPDSPYLKYVANTNGSAFSVNALPLPGAAIPRGYNTTGEELIRVAMSFATNSQDIYPAWSPLTTVTEGEIYLPTTPNGHKYYAQTAGLTGSAEPTWPTSPSGTVTDGDVDWEEVGATVLGQAGLTRANVKKDSFKWPLNRQSSVNQIKGNYRDANNDFALTPFKVNDRTHQARVNKIYPLEIDLSGVDNFHQTNRLANWQLAKNREGDWFNALGTGPQGLVLEEGDPICSSDDSGGLINVVTRVEELRIHANHDVTIAQARRYSTLMFLDEVGADTIPVPTTLRYTQTVDSIAAFIDSYPIRDADALVIGFYIAVSRDLTTDGDWRGWALYADYGDGYLQIAQGDLPAIMGVANNTLATVTDASVFDRANLLNFTLQYGPPNATPFTSVTETELLANPRRNLFRVGNEYLQAATIEDTGDQTYVASTLLRGRFGTNTTELTHAADEQVVYLDGSEVLVSIDPVRLNQEYNYKVVTVNQDVADATAIPFTWTGGTAKPLPPSNIRGQRDAEGNLLVLWNRSARMGAGMTSGTDVPLAEEGEKYIVETYDGSTLKRAMTAIVGMNLPAIMLGLDETPAGTSKNSIELLGPAFTGHTAQIVPVTGNFFEAEMGGGVSPSFETSQFGFIAPNADWTNTANSNTAFDLLVVYSKTNLGGGVFRSTFFIYERGVLVATLNYDGSTYLITPRIRVLLQSGEFRVYLNWAGASSVPIYVSGIRPRPPYTVGVHCSGTNFAYLRSAIMTISPQPATVYSVAQETEDGLAAPVKLRIYQISAVVGKGGYAEATI